MKIVSIAISRFGMKTLLYDLFACAVITFIPAFSHMTSIPVYYFDPIRIILFLSIIYTSKENVYLLTLILPFFSFMISQHPVFLKSWLMSSELTLNVFLFFYLNKRFENTYISIAVSIIASKIYYYAGKFVLISLGLLSMDFVATPIYYQIIVWIALSLIVGYVIKKKKVSN